MQGWSQQIKMVHTVPIYSTVPSNQCRTIGMQKGQVTHRACACEFLITMLSSG